MVSRTIGGLVNRSIRPLCHLSKMIARGLEPRLIALKGRGFSQLIYATVVGLVGVEPTRLSATHFECVVAAITPQSRLLENL